MLVAPFDPTTINFSAKEMIQMIVAIIVIISGLLAVLYSIWGGFLLITSGGNEEKVKPAVNYIRHAFLGLIVLVLIIFATPKVLGLFGLPFAEDMRPSEIFATMKVLSANFFNTSIDSPRTLDSGDSLDTLPSDFSDL